MSRNLRKNKKKVENLFPKKWGCVYSARFQGNRHLHGRGTRRVAIRRRFIARGKKRAIVIWFHVKEAPGVFSLVTEKWAKLWSNASGGACDKAWKSTRSARKPASYGKYLWQIGNLIFMVKRHKRFCRGNRHYHGREFICHRCYNVLSKSKTNVAVTDPRIVISVINYNGIFSSSSFLRKFDGSKILEECLEHTIWIFMRFEESTFRWVTRILMKIHRFIVQYWSISLDFAWKELVRKLHKLLDL